MSECYLYVIGHEHATFGHAVKVGIAGNIGARIASLQTGNPNELKLYFAFRFPYRELATRAERLFHESELAGPIRGEWVGRDPEEVLYYLTIIVSRVLRSYFDHDDELAKARKDAGLLDAFDIIDALPSERQAELNDRYAAFDDWLEGGRP